MQPHCLVQQCWLSMTRAGCTVMPASSSGLVFLDKRKAESFIKNHTFKCLYTLGSNYVNENPAFVKYWSFSASVCLHPSAFNSQDIFSGSVNVKSHPPLPLNLRGVTLRFGLTWQQRTQARVNLQSFCCCKHIARLHHHHPPPTARDPQTERTS